MTGYRRILVEGAGLLCIGGLLFAFPEESLEAAREGITLCLDVLIPSLFPFFVLSSLLIETGVAGFCARPLSRWMYPLFGVGGAGAAALVLGLIGGYPAGARTIAQLVERGEWQPGGGTPPLPVLQQLWPSLFPGGRWNGGLWF